MKKIFMILTAVLLTASMSAKDLTGIKFYVNPGHGSFSSNDRPMATISYPMLPTTGKPDTCGFYESNTNLQKGLYLGKKLEAAGATVMYSHTECGPWPYTMVNGDYPDFTNEGYNALPDRNKYNRDLVEITVEVEANNIDYFISIHSNAATEGTSTNYPIYLYRGTDSNRTDDGTGKNYVAGSYEKAQASWPHRNEIMLSGIDPSTSYKNSMNIRGDITFMGSSSNRTHANGKTYTGYYGVLKHGASGFLVEGYFHTYQPARHRALNYDYCHMEGLAYYRGIVDYYGADKENVGYIMGTVKDSLFKMNHSLFQYAPKTNDQWVPCNGAEVILKKGGVEVDRYTVDNNYNGLFIFEGLEPGDDYTLEASCEGYHPMHEVHKAPFSVKANETTYKFLHLNDTAYIPPTIHYTNYPNPNQPIYLDVPKSFEMEQVFVNKQLDKLFTGKTIRRALYRNGLMYVLAIDSKKEPTLAVVNPDSCKIETTLPTDFCSVVSTNGYKLSDISFTAEGVLVGCNMEAVTCNPSNKWNLYKWTKANGKWTGTLWQSHANNETAGNYNNAMVGTTLAYSGTLTEGIIATTAYTTGSSTHGTRFVIYTISDDRIEGSLRNQPEGVTLAEYGHEIQMVVSPRDSSSFIFSSPNKEAFEWQIVNTTKSAPTIKGTMPFHTHVANYFKYANKSLMVAPLEELGALNTGIAVYDITDGVDKPILIKTTNTTLDISNPAYTMAAAQVKDANLTLYLLKDNSLSKFSTIGVTQPAIPAIMAYNLNVSLKNEIYTFTFDANTDAISAEVVFYNAQDVEVGRIPVKGIKQGHNSIDLKAAVLPDSVGATLTWAVQLTGNSISNFGIIASDNSLIESSTSRLFNAVNTNPESDQFGHIYVMHRAGSSSSANAPKSGIWEFDHNLAKQNTEVYKGGVAKFGNPTRMSMDREGYLYIADWADGNSGIFMANTADMTQPFTQFFAGTRDGNGVFNNNGAYTGSSTPGCYVYDNGKEVKLFVYNEDPAGTLPKNGMAVYNIGQADGTILHKWETAPSAVYTLTGQANTEGNPWGTSHGFFVSQVREDGQNNTGATSLKFYDNAGNEQMSSASDLYKEIITGSNAGGYVVSADESVLVFNDGAQNFLVFDITWEGDKPVLALRYTIKHGIAKIRQMNWDYAGNIVCTGDAGIYLVSLPSKENTTLIPAKKALTLIRTAGIAVEGMQLSNKEATIEVGETIDLSTLPTFTPLNATNTMVKWESTEQSIATIDIDGIATAKAVGTTKIAVTSVEGNFSDTLTLTVKPISVKGIKILAGNNGVMYIGKESNYSIAYSIRPANAANKNTIWTSSDSTIVDIQNTALIIGLKTGEATITVTTEDGGYQDHLKVIVKEAVQSVTLNHTTLNMVPGEKDTLTATIAPENATLKTVSWESSDNNIATVVDGVVTAMAVGTATITATADNVTTTCIVTITQPVTGVVLDQTKAELEVSETLTLVATVLPENATDKSVVWTSDKDSIATVTDGVVTAVAPGIATITVTTVDGNHSATCVITVLEPIIKVTGVTLDITELTLDVPQTATLKATVAPEDATDKSITWASDNETVATVAEGVVTAVAEGTANITVTTTDGGFKATCVVTVRIVDGVMNIQVLDVNASMYDVLGRQVDNTYRGIVIQNGQKFMLQ